MTKGELYQEFLKETNQDQSEYHDHIYSEWLENKIISSDTLPENYEEKKDGFMDFLEAAYLVDMRMQSVMDIADKVDKGIDNWTKYVRG